MCMKVPAFIFLLSTPADGMEGIWYILDTANDQYYHIFSTNIR
jgi:hypothetical protein